METTPIEIDLNVYKAIQQELTSFSDTPNQVLRRKYGMKEKPTTEPKTDETSDGMYIQGEFLRNGLCLRKNYKGKIYTAEVVDGEIVVNKGKHTMKCRTPSNAAMAITKSPVNGWKWWQYQNKDGQWVLLDNLRKRRIR